MKLLRQLTEIHAPSGAEGPLKSFILDHIEEHKSKWAVTPAVYEGEYLHDNIVMVFGIPRTAIFAHMDSIGFTVRYENQLIPIGSPDVKSGYELVGADRLGPIDCKLVVDKDHHLFYDFPRGIQTGTSLTFKPDFRETKNYVTSPYLDNRLGIYNALKVAETLRNGIIVFSTYEEHGGGSVPMLMNFIMHHFPVKQALISDITWMSDGVHHGDGVAISLRDRHIPRKKFTDGLIQLAANSGIPFQVEVEGSGSSDGREVHFSPYPVDWCFIGAPESNVHSPNEKVHTADIQSMIAMYQYLMESL